MLVIKQGAGYQAGGLRASVKGTRNKSISVGKHQALHFNAGKALTIIFLAE